MAHHGACTLMQAHGCAGDEVNRCADGLELAPSWLDLIPQKLTIDENLVSFNALTLHL
jgi:hypothetical protein